MPHHAGQSLDGAALLRLIQKSVESNQIEIFLSGPRLAVLASKHRSHYRILLLRDVAARHLGNWWRDWFWSIACELVAVVNLRVILGMVTCFRSHQNTDTAWLFIGITMSNGNVFMCYLELVISYSSSRCLR